jgi:hypothetical protein
MKDGELYRRSTAAGKEPAFAGVHRDGAVN